MIQASLVDLNTGGLVPNLNINCKYLFYLFKSLNIKDYVKGSAVPTINSKKLKETVVPLPPLSEQRCWIWQCVGSWSSRIQMMNQPVSYSAELIKEKKIKKSKPLPLITDDEKPFDIPDSWEWVRLGDIVFNYDGRRVPVSISDRRKRRKVYITMVLQEK